MTEPFPCGHTRRITIGGQCAECTRYAPPRPSADTMMPPEEWCRSYGVAIIDPSGWHAAGAPSFDEPCTLRTFWTYALRSARADPDARGWNGMFRDMRYAEEASH